MPAFTEKTLLLTGAAGGIGQEVAQVFYDRGANLVLADRSLDALEHVVAERGFAESRVLPLVIDAAQRGYSDPLVDAALERFGTIDFLAPAAGVLLGGVSTGITAEDFDLSFDINVRGSYELVWNAAPKVADGGSVVMFGALAAYRGMVEYPHYAATKGAIHAMMKSFALLYAPRIRVNAVAPGLIETPMTAHHGTSTSGSRTLSETPLGRAGRPAEVATVVAFLCSDDAGYMTGQAVHVNGGTVRVG